MTQLLRLSTEIATFIIYVRKRRNGQMQQLKLNQAMHTTETLLFLKDLKKDLDSIIKQIYADHPELITYTPVEMF